MTRSFDDPIARSADRPIADRQSQMNE